MADRQNRVGSKIGGAGVAGSSESNVDRRERLRKLALETIGKNSFVIPAWLHICVLLLIFYFVFVFVFVSP